jgi:hypothetical protein
VRVIVELRRVAGGGVEGAVTREGSGERHAFFGWLELLRLLEDLEPDADDA